MSRGDIEICWDSWGVPHIFAASDQALFFAFAWAQMENHRTKLLQLYATARGRAAQYWGASYLDSDKWMHMMDVPNRASIWYQQQSPEFRKCLDAFAAGVNCYAATHRNRLNADLIATLPVSAVDVLAHVQALIHFSFLTEPKIRNAAAAALQQGLRHVGRQNQRTQVRQPISSTISEVFGSNAWAVRAQRTNRGAMLLGNPHIAWDGSHIFFEAHLISPGIDIYGATLVGFPVPVCGFNQQLAWTHTQNDTRGATLYELELKGSGYKYGSSLKPLISSHKVLKVLGSDHTLRHRSFYVRQSVHGPLIAENGNRAIALRVAGLDTSGIYEQWWNMACSKTLGEFEAALRRMQLPLYNVIYADRANHIMHLCGGLIPCFRSAHNVRRTPAPGNTPRTLWREFHNYEDLPRLVDPPSGWLQNANDPPWTNTIPAQLKETQFPYYMAGSPPSYRAQRSIRLLNDASEMSFDKLLKCKNSARSELADHIVPDLIRIAATNSDPQIRYASKVLAAWDRETRANSRGALLFQKFVRLCLDRNGGLIPFSHPDRAKSVLSPPAGLRKSDLVVRLLREAVAEILEEFGSLNRPWGDVNRLRSDSIDLPATGGSSALGTFRVLEFRKDSDSCYRACAGDTFVFAVAFGPRRRRARVLLTYGNASELNSTHRSDQLSVYAANRLRNALLSRTAILRHLEKRELLRFRPNVGAQK